MKFEKIASEKITDEEVKMLRSYLNKMNQTRKQLNAGCFKIEVVYKNYNATIIVTDKETQPIECLEGENEPYDIEDELEREIEWE